MDLKHSNSRIVSQILFELLAEPLVLHTAYTMRITKKKIWHSWWSHQSQELLVSARSYFLTMVCRKAIVDPDQSCDWFKGLQQVKKNLMAIYLSGNVVRKYDHWSWISTLKLEIHMYSKNLWLLIQFWLLWSEF